MNIERNIKTMLAVFVLLFALLAGYLVYVIDAYGAYWFASPYNLRVSKRGSSVVAGDILDREGELLATTDENGGRVYQSGDELRLATGHVLGDNYSQTIGAEALFARYLLGFDRGLISGLDGAVRGDDITLTISAELSAFAREQLAEKRGAIILMNYKTGEILASTSSPGFDVALMGGFTSGEYSPEDGSLVNRATMGRYTPGSTFKIVTTIAALRHIPNVLERTFECEGCLAFNADTGALTGDDPFGADGELLPGYAVLRDIDGNAHGPLTLEEAFEHSCNNVFALLALEIGADNLYKTAEELGLNGEFIFDETIAYCGTYERAASDYELAWSGVGQYKDIMTPIHMCLLTSAIANGGTAMEPKLLLGAANKSGATHALEPEEYKAILKGNEAEFLAECMRKTVQEGTGTKASVSGVSVAGKTGTGEVSSGGAIKPNAWFAGFIESESYPYAICVVVEDGGSGGSVAAPIAAAVFERAMALQAE